MKKIICIPFFLLFLLLVASCKGSVTPENPDDSHNSNNQQEEQEVSAVVDKFFWGTWVRMDSGAVYEIDESKISVYKKDSDQLDNTYNAISSVGDGTFADCSSLSQITIPQSISTIGSSAFRDCLILKRINYNDTKSQWKSTWNSFFPSGTTIYCTNGNISL